MLTNIRKVHFRVALLYIWRPGYKFTPCRIIYFPWYGHQIEGYSVHSDKILKINVGPYNRCVCASHFHYHRSGDIVIVVIMAAVYMI